MFDLNAKSFIPCCSALLLLAALSISAQSPALHERDFPSEPQISPTSDSSATRSAEQTQYRYRNEDDRSITASRFVCVTGPEHGSQGWVASQRDAFGTLALPDFPGREEAIRRAMIETGESFEFEIDFGPSLRRPLDVASCGLTAVIFEDGTGQGAPQELEGFYSARRTTVANLMDLHRVIDGATERDRDPGGPLLDRIQSLPGSARYSEIVESIRSETLTTGNLPIARVVALRDGVRRDLDILIPHLSPADREELEDLQ